MKGLAFEFAEGNDPGGREPSMDAKGRRVPLKACVDGNKRRRDGKADAPQHGSGPQPRRPVEDSGGKFA